MASIISAGTTSATALNMSADTSGVLQLSSNNGTVAATVDTSQRVGVGLTTLTERFEVNGAIGASTSSSNNFATGNARAFMDYVPGSNTARLGQLNGASGLTTGKLSLFNNGLESIAIDAAGRIRLPYQPAFSATGTGSPSIAIATVIPINNKTFDVGNNFNTSTYTFTAPIAGKYLFSFSVRYNGYPANVYLHPGLQKNGGTVGQSQGINSIASTVGDAYMSVTNTIIFDLAANDTVRLFDGSESGTTGTYEAGQCVLTGYLLG